MFVLFASILLLLIHHGECIIEATANLQLDGTSVSIGILKFIQKDANSPVVITGVLTSLNHSSNHGFHVHTDGVAETSPNCTAAGAHFNPYHTGHGHREADIMHRHVGDLGNLTTDVNGTVAVHIEDNIIQFYNSTQSIANRTIIVHRMFDDGGLGTGESNLTGNSGARLACSLIKITLVDVVAAKTLQKTSVGPIKDSSNGLNIKPTTSVLFLTIISVFIMSFY